MIAELKMVCTERQIKIQTSCEEVKPVDLVAAVRQHIKALNIQDQLNWLETTVKDKYKDIFASIPHIDDLPTNIYC